jgi:hypothetical protein
MKPFVKDAAPVMLPALQGPSALDTLRQNRSSLRFEKFVNPYPSLLSRGKVRQWEF